jgi:uncharacterized protein (DUF4415 family)
MPDPINPPQRPRRPVSTRDAAEAVFQPRPKAPVEALEEKKPATLPGVKEQVMLRIDRDVLDYFQDEGAGWQDRINAALRKAAGL